MKSLLFDYLFDADMSLTALGRKSRKETSVDFLLDIKELEDKEPI